MNTNTQEETAVAILGYPGQIISWSKLDYRLRHPNNVVVFNANICLLKSRKIWYGDIDVTLSKEKLQQLANTLKQTVYVLREMDARFENEEKPLLKFAIATIEPATQYN
jgi:hypothetical protein